MFLAGVVKLTSECESWWALEALDWHYQSQCIPGPLAWWAHHAPHWLNALGVVATFAIEVFIPFLNFSPIGTLRTVSFATQAVLMVCLQEHMPQLLYILHGWVHRF